jgi:hypothetical protein
VPLSATNLPMPHTTIVYLMTVYSQPAWKYFASRLDRWYPLDYIKGVG